MPREQRRLAAIVSADVAGYSRLMGRDESGTLAALNAHRRELVDPLIAEHNGRIVKSTGDGLLLEFSSVVDAVRCAVAVQNGMVMRNASVAGDECIRFRVGINVGDVIVEGNDIFGDGVNIAARLEQLADPDSICLSNHAYRDVRGRLDAVFVDSGEYALKNIAEPVRIWRWSNNTHPVRSTAPLTTLAVPERPSIAVLPFSSMSGDLEQDYFGDGVVEDITIALSRTRWLFVVARNSSFSYKGRPVDVKQVGRELGVRYVLEGSIRKAGNRVRISSQLIEAASGAHLWADRFEGATEDTFALQDQVTEGIVGVLLPNLERAEIERVQRKSTVNLDAYDCYLRARASARIWSRERLDEALSFCARAIELDPAFAPAYGQAARCYSLRKANGWVGDPRAESVEADRLAHGAWRADPDDAVAIGLAAHALAYVVMDLDAGAAYIERALASNPNYAENWAISGWINVWLGRDDVAIDHVARAMQLSPRDPMLDTMHAITATALFFAGRYDEALSLAMRALQERPNAHQALRIGAASAAMAGRTDEAVMLGQKLTQADPRLRVSTLRNVLGPYRNPECPARYAEALRRAGLPQS